MSKIEEKKISKKRLGERFRLFREAIEKAQHELAGELSISQSTIANIERGKAFPNITYLYYFYNKYHLNINWLLTANGEMFSRRIPENDKYAELLNLMQVPAVEQVILARMIELKALLRDEINTFRDKETDKGKEEGDEM